jgi:hypothetical protein
MAEAVFGTGVVVEMLDDVEYYEVLCGLDCTFTRTPEIIETTNPTSGRSRAFMIRREEWDISVSGLTKIANDTSLTFFYMLQTSIRWLEKTIRVTFTDADGANVQISGTVLIGAESISGPATDFAQCSIEFKGIGPFTITGVLPPAELEYILYSDWWETINGDNYIAGSSSGLSPSAVLFGGPFNLGATDVILDVAVDGDHYNLIDSGTPGNLECKFDNGLGQITFAADLIFDGTQRVYVEFKREV